MTCPFCQAPSFETQPECGSCGFSLERVEKYFGVLPRLQPGLSDLAGVLRPAEIRDIAAATARLHERFPQVFFSVVTSRLRPEQPLAAWAFWVFNRGGLCRELDKGGRSRDFLLTVDVAQARANLIIGYGLEPFIAAGHLRQALEGGATLFARAAWAEGIRAVVTRASALLDAVSTGIGRVYGLDMNEIRRAESAAPSLAGAAVW